MTEEEALYELAKANNTRVHWWWGRRGGSSRREYICYLCGCCIDTESAQYPMTAHVSEAITAHRNVHIAASKKLIRSGLVPIPQRDVNKLDGIKLVGARKIAGVLCVPQPIAFVLAAKLGRHTKATLQRVITDPVYYQALLAADVVGAVKTIVTQQETAQSDAP